MAIVKQFDRSMIEQCLRKIGWRFLVDSDGDFEIRINYDEDMNCQLNVNFLVQGTEQTIYAIRVTSDKRFPKNQWGQAVMTCNTWNKDKIWPKAYFSVKDPDRDTFGTIVLEYYFDFEQGVHQELFDDMTLNIVGSANAFWEWIYKEQDL
jgi:hypothetical protein